MATDIQTGEAPCPDPASSSSAKRIPTDADAAGAVHTRSRRPPRYIPIEICENTSLLDPNATAILSTSPTLSQPSTSASTIVTDLSSIVFARDRRPVTMGGFGNVVLKTVRDAELAQQEVAILERLTEANVPFTLRLLDVYEGDEEGEESDLPVPRSRGVSRRKLSVHDDYDDDDGRTVDIDHEPRDRLAVDSDDEDDDDRGLEMRPASSHLAPSPEPLSLTLVLPVLEPLPTRHLDLVVVADLARDLLTSLKHMHALRIAHLDLTLANLMRDPSTKELRVIDFGLARAISGPSSPHPCGRGTPGHVAPEVLDGHGWCGAADVYGAGVVLGQLMEPYLPGFSLQYLGSKLVRPSTTTFISQRLREAARCDPESGEPVGEAGAEIVSGVLRMAADFLAGMLEPE
ncbi:hypothetical protein HK101_002024, partial [Irineochytrium annulatum]